MNWSHFWIYLKIVILGYWETFMSHVWIWIFILSTHIPVPLSWVQNCRIKQNDKTYLINDVQLKTQVSDTDIVLRDITVEMITFMKFNSIHLIEDLKTYYPGWFNKNYQIIIRFYDADWTDVKDIKLLTIYVENEKYLLSTSNEKDPVDLQFGEILFDP